MSKVVDRATAILAYLEDQVDAMVEMLVDLASHESPSDVPESQVGVQSQLTDVLQELDFRIRHVPGRKTGGHLFAVPINRDRNMPVQLLVGHTDTVWPLGTAVSCKRFLLYVPSDLWVLNFLLPLSGSLIPMKKSVAQSPSGTYE